MFANQAAGFGAKFKNRQSWCVVYIDGRAVHLAQVVVEPFPIGGVQLSAQNLAARYGTDVRQQAVYQLYVVHFEREEGYWYAIVYCNVLGKAEGKRSLTHRRTPRDNNKVGRLPARSNLVQLGETSRYPRQAAILLVIGCFEQ